jgi:putative transcriptional regulator
MKNNDSSVFQSIMTGLQEAVEYERGTLKKPVRTRTVSIASLPHYQGGHIKQIRQKLRLTQATFAQVFGVSLKTVEAWESVRNTPQGPAQRILSLLDQEDDFLETHRLMIVSNQPHQRP